jgi:hypothetical protein
MQILYISALLASAVSAITPSISLSVGRTVSVSAQTIITYQSFNINAFTTTTYASFIGSDATASTFACQRECFTGIEAFPTFPICAGHVESPKLLTLAATSVGLTSIAPLSDYQRRTSITSSSSWLYSQNCKLNGTVQMICTVEQTGPSYLLSNPFPTGAERSILMNTEDDTTSALLFPTTTEGVTAKATGRGITHQTSSFTVKATDIKPQFLVVTAGLGTEAKPKSNTAHSVKPSPGQSGIEVAGLVAASLFSLLFIL